MSTFELILALAIIVAFAGQTIALYLIYGMIKRLDAKAAEMQRGIQPILAKTNETIVKSNRVLDEVSVEVKACVAAITATTTELSKLSLHQANEIAGFIEDATSSARQQIARLERTVSLTANRVEETTAIVQSNVLGPVREISAIIIAVKRALEVLFRSDRKQVDQAYQDEEMFI